MVLLFAWFAGCACNPELPDDNDDTNVDSGTSPTTTDTGPPPACAQPESEPNNTPDEADRLVLEQRGCGTLSGEPDVFAFSLEEPGWVEVEVEGDEGSIADVTYTLNHPSFDRLLQVFDGIETTDARVALQAPAGEYSLVVTEQNAGGGDRFTYRVLVSEIKAPTEWTLEESEPNDAFNTAEIVGDGDSVYGEIIGDGAPDSDWYRLSIDPGRHEVVLDVDSREFGSGANVQARLYDENLEVIRVIDGGQVDAVEPDPFFVYASNGNEELFVEIRHQSEGAAEGIDRWYVLHIGVEAQ